MTKASTGLAFPETAREGRVWNVTVLLGDSRRPYGYNPTGRIEPHDLDDIAHMKGALRGLHGFRFRFLDEHDRFLSDLAARPPDFVLNFCNTGFRNRAEHQYLVPALLESLEVPYLGADARAITFCHDKAAVSAVAASIGVPVPAGHLLKVAPDTRVPEHGPLPALIKPNDGDGSTGVSETAIVRDWAAAQRYLDDLAAARRRGEDGPVSVLMQEWLDAPEYSVALIGNPQDGFAPLPPLEIDFSALPEGTPEIMSYASKTDPASTAWNRVRFRPARLDDAGRQRIIGHCARLFARLGCRDYARFDLRTDANGEVRVIDVNAHPMWGYAGMMTAMAGYAGHDYSGFLRLILDAGIRRLTREGVLQKETAPA
jgi:D-alanine-D-alanine ligase